MILLFERLLVGKYDSTYSPETDYFAVEALLRDETTFGGSFDDAQNAADRIAQEPQSIFFVISCIL